MKKFIPLAFLLIFSTGCAAPTNPFTAKRPSFDKPFTAVCDIECGDIEAAADVKRSADGSWSFSFTQPPALMGLSMKLSEQGFSASLGSLSMEVDESDIYRLIPDLIAQGVDALCDSSSTLTENDGVLSLVTKLEGSTVTINADKSSGELISLKCPSQKLSVMFTSQQPVLETEETSGALILEDE